jgi:phosphatidate cytidylyltransferase
MLKQRIITALLLLAVLLPAMFHPAVAPFALLSLLLVAAAGWELARMNACGPARARWAGAALAVVMLGVWWAGGLEQAGWPFWLVVGLAWLAVSVVLLQGGVTRWQDWPAAPRLWGGMVLLAAAWLALVQAHQMGIVFLLSTLTLVWAADIAAYAGGKAFGRRKLAPALSPGKSWEGAISGFVGVCLLSWFWLWFDRAYPSGAPSLFSRLWDAGPFWLVMAVVCLTAASVVGDLLESLVKRGAGVKDSSQLLPGHGGVLDRVDALLPVLPLAMLLAQLLER